MDALANIFLGFNPFVVLGAVPIQSSSICVLGFCHRLSVCLSFLLLMCLVELNYLYFTSVNFCDGCLEVTQGHTLILGLVTVDFHVP